jgi:predicted secreted Zn-dependent protease
MTTPVLRAVLLSVLFLARPGGAAERPSPRIAANVTVTTNYYVVTGGTAAELRASKAQARPWKDKLAFDGGTEWNIRWTFNCSRQGDQFELDSVDIKTRVVVNLPQWTPPPEASRDLIDRWQRFLTSLSTHERGHVTLARLATAELQKQIAAVKPSPSAKELASAADLTGRKVVESYREKEREYDKETNHGISQGAVFRW